MIDETKSTVETPPASPRSGMSGSGKVLGAIAVVAVLGLAGWWFSPLSSRYRYERADLVTLSRLTESNPKDGLAWRTLGLRLARQTDPLAEKPLTEAYALNPADVEVSTALGGLYLGMKRYGEAYEFLRRSTESSPNYLPARVALGRLYQVKGSYHHAAEQFERVVKLSPDDAASWHDLAQCYFQMQQSDKASKAMAEALRIKPGEPRYLSFQGTLVAANGRVDEGLRDLKEAADKAPDEVAVQGALLDGLIKYNRGPDDLRLAGQVIDRLQQKIPTAPRLMFLRGELARLSGDLPGAVAQLKQVIQIAPQLDDTYYSLGRAYQQIGRGQDADRMLSIYRERKSVRQRIDDVRTALGSRPNDTALQKELADLQVRVEDYPAALDTLEAVSKQAPDDFEIRTKLASLRKLMGQIMPGS